MPVYGLVITLESHVEFEQLLLEELCRDPRITLGDRSGLRLALATETETAAEQRDLHDHLLDHPAVVHVDTTFAEVNGLDPDDIGPAGANKPGTRN
jgi:hypothetical protein